MREALISPIVETCTLSAAEGTPSAHFQIRVEPLDEGVLASSDDGQLPELFAAFSSVAAMREQLPEVIEVILAARDALGTGNVLV